MSTLGHVAVGMACGRAFSTEETTARRAAMAFTLISLWPDIDVIGFPLGIGYAEPLGHRGATHSLALAAFVGLAAYAYAQRRGLPARRVAIFATIAAASHGLLDTMTYGGGLGCALLWPLSDARFWAPVRFIPIAPIGLGLISSRGAMVMLTELVIFTPLWLYALWPRRKTKPD